MDERFDGVPEPARSERGVCARAEGAATDASSRADSAGEPGPAPVEPLAGKATNCVIPLIS